MTIYLNKYEEIKQTNQFTEAPLSDFVFNTYLHF